MLIFFNVQLGGTMATTMQEYAMYVVAALAGTFNIRLADLNVQLGVTVATAMQEYAVYVVAALTGRFHTRIVDLNIQLGSTVATAMQEYAVYVVATRTGKFHTRLADHVADANQQCPHLISFKQDTVELGQLGIMRNG